MEQPQLFVNVPCIKYLFETFSYIFCGVHCLLHFLICCFVVLRTLDKPMFTKNIRYRYYLHHFYRWLHPFAATKKPGKLSTRAKAAVVVELHESQKHFTILCWKRNTRWKCSWKYARGNRAHYGYTVIECCERWRMAGCWCCCMPIWMNECNCFEEVIRL